MKQEQGWGLSLFPVPLCSTVLCAVYDPGLATDKAREDGIGENSTVLYGQQGIVSTYSAYFPPTFSFFFSPSSKRRGC